MPQLPLAELNQLSRDAFTAALNNVFEHSPRAVTNECGGRNKPLIAGRPLPIGATPAPGLRPLVLVNAP
jgi:hypothetical protein